MCKYQLKKDEKILFEGNSENECLIKLQKIQSQSWDWAFKYEGYKIEKVNNDN